MVKITLWVENAALVQSSMINWEGFFHPKDIVLDDLNSIRDFIVSKEHWKISVDEHVMLEGSNVPYLLSDAELDWFASEASRMHIRTPLIGYFLNYSLFISLEKELALTLGNASDYEKSFCEWSGCLDDLVGDLRQKVGYVIAEGDLLLWIVRYHRSNSHRLSIVQCELIVRKVLSTEVETPLSSLPLPAAAEELPPPPQGQQAAVARYVEDKRRIFDFPLLAVMCRHQPDGRLDALRVWGGNRLGISTCSVHFHCTVCGCRSPTAGKGYRLALGTKGTERVLKILHYSLSVLQLMLQLGGVPNQISAIAEFAIRSLDILATDLKVELQKIAQVHDIEDLRKAFVDAKAVASKGKRSSTMLRQRSVLFDFTKPVFSCPLTVCY